MSHEKDNYMVDNKNFKPVETVSIPVSLFESIEGRYFVGQTEPLLPGDGAVAWAGLVNPRNSGVDLFVNVFTISNFSDDYVTAEIWLNTDFPENSMVSHKVSPTNTALRPLRRNRVELRYVKSTTRLPQAGVNVYERIVPPKTTLVGEEDGKFIEPPGGNYTIVIKSASSRPDKVIVALGWWEKPIC